MMMSETSQYVIKGVQGFLLTIDRGHNESDLSGVGGASEMGVDLLGLVLVKGDESVQDVIARRGIVGATY